MARELHYRKKDNKYALWSTIVDDYVTEWKDKEEIRKQWYLDKLSRYYDKLIPILDKEIRKIEKEEMER